MIKNDYDIELNRLSHINTVDIPHLRNVQMIIKDRVDAHTYEPIIFDHLKGLSDNPSLPNDLTKLRDGNNHNDIFEQTYSDIRVDTKFTDTSGRRIRFLKIYHEGKITASKVLIYLHGGAYYGGTPEDTLPFLKLLASEFAGVIYSVDYGIAPENPYPSAINDCLAVIAEAKKNYVQVSLSGDSAGASIALGAGQLSHLMGICEIYKYILFYPTVVHGSDHDGSLWDDNLISIDNNQRRVLHNNYTQFKQLDTIMTEFYTDHQEINLHSPIISPLYADPTGFKRVLIMTGEFDPFRLQDEAFIQKVGMAGCTAKYIRYGGLGHAFLNYINQIPAVEDSIIECAKALK
ncbi:alpha/beta hydrolase fold domain-containing protein [Companilactobacillus nuruki]|uniref:Esterase n=1 Tax=Companilactobacillus nuruki TaxID=1993540 RepID=A0A2N7AR59_9LACO|nr:alpha/beta hydrolase fold domain-containing protein [Companilactobacillus nuruki]PMD67841.1 esterase [Companilactobacillus nuruki]